MVLDKLPVLRCLTNLNKARAYCPCSRCGWGLFGHFFSLVYQSSLLFPSLSRRQLDTELQIRRGYRDNSGIITYISPLK